MNESFLLGSFRVSWRTVGMIILWRVYSLRPHDHFFPYLSWIAPCSGLCHSSLLHFIPAFYCPSSFRLLFTHHLLPTTHHLLPTTGQSLLLNTPCYIMVVFSLAQMYCNIHSKTVCMEFSDWHNIFLVFNPHFSEYKYRPPIRQGEPVRDISLPFFPNGYQCRTGSEWPGPGTSGYLILVHDAAGSLSLGASRERATDSNHRATHVRRGVCLRHIGIRLDWVWSPSIRSGENGSRR